MHPASPSDPSGTTVAEAKAEIHLLNFKTTWLEFEKVSQTATEQGKAELRIYNL